jgi:hypothetical protein
LRWIAKATSTTLGRVERELVALLEGPRLERRGDATVAVEALVVGVGDEINIILYP